MEDQWWWMSFCDPERPPGQQFLGVAIVDAPTLADAVTRSHLLGINPGGEIGIVEVPDEHVPPADFRNRLLDRETAEAAGRF